MFPYFYPATKRSDSEITVGVLSWQRNKDPLPLSVQCVIDTDTREDMTGGEFSHLPFFGGADLMPKWNRKIGSFGARKGSDLAFFHHGIF